MKLTRFIPLLLIFLALSCTVQKRQHQSGYYVSWSHKKTESKKNVAASAERKALKKSPAVLDAEVHHEPVESASASNEIIPAELVTPRSVISFTDAECDLIVMRNGEEIRAKVQEISSALIKYKRCDLPDGPLYTVNKSEVFMVKYPNGSKEVMPEPSTTRQPDYRSSTTQAPVISKKDKKLEPFALIGFLAVIVGLLVPYLGLAMLLLLSGIIMCIIAITKVSNNPDKLKGKGLAITGLVIGLVVGALVLLALSVM